MSGPACSVVEFGQLRVLWTQLIPVRGCNSHWHPFGVASIYIRNEFVIYFLHLQLWLKKYLCNGFLFPAILKSHWTSNQLCFLFSFLFQSCQYSQVLTISVFFPTRVGWSSFQSGTLVLRSVYISHLSFINSSVMAL